MTDIIIKSFNRPHYLERCLNSVYQFVTGDFKVHVLDDGTPEKYLQKIKWKFPEIEIKTSENYFEKTKAIEENLKSGKEINGFQIPTKLWHDAVLNASEYFIITEDDVWFTEKINVDDLSENCKKHEISLLKLGWLGNNEDEKNIDIQGINSKINSAKPKKLFLSSEKIMESFFYNKYKFFTILFKLGKVDHFTQRKYWAINSILMGFWNKKYWLYIWKNFEGKVDEKRQLINASVYYKKHQNNPNFIAKLKNEAMKTTFQSSATGSYHNSTENFDVNIFNFVLNEAWFEGKFDVMQNFPKDFSEDYIENFIAGNPKISGWKTWAEKFREQYRKQGCNVD